MAAYGEIKCDTYPFANNTYSYLAVVFVPPVAH